MAAAASSMDCTTRRAAVWGYTQNSGTSSARMKEVWSPKKLRPMTVLNGAWNRLISQMAWSGMAMSKAGVP